MILRNCKKRLTGLEMAFIGYKKVYDMVLHSWLKKCMIIFGFAKNMQMLLVNNMEKWNAELFVLALLPMSLVLRGVEIGYSLGYLREKISQSLSMDDLKSHSQNGKQFETLVNAGKRFIKDIRMRFTISKCATLIMKRGIISRSETM